MFQRLFKDHPESVGESYLEHLGTAFGFGVRMASCGIACLVHGLFPFLFKTTARRCIEELHTKVVSHRVKDCNRDRVIQPAE